MTADSEEKRTAKPTPRDPLDQLDIGELEHYVDVLESSAGHVERRAQTAQLLQDFAACWPNSKAVQRFTLAVGRFDAWGYGIDEVREAFQEIRVLQTAASTSRREEEMRRRESAAHGRRGGRPSAAWAEVWQAEIDKKRARNPELSRTRAIQLVAASWRDSAGKPRAASTIRDAVARLKKANAKPPFSR